METSLKSGFAQIFPCCPKNLSYPKFGGAAAPLAPPARTPMILNPLGFLKRPLQFLWKDGVTCFEVWRQPTKCRAKDFLFTSV